ncbi:sperm-associated microtubule inner protein 5-like [Macrobrachium nipponense]|uniref:sperm-associated microtubule inner protein 5-like n=1 Tax=Macrobrachium nipponense TaxID=159736 RepID=UPI0030C7E89D
MMNELGAPSTPIVRRRTYIVGYSGYIPGLMFRYGQTFGKAAEESIALYLKQQAERRVREEVKRSRSLPRLKPKRSDAQVIEDFYNKYGLDGRSNPDYPPLPGYTGYIPKVKPTDLGIGKTFSAAARSGLACVSLARERREVLNPQLHPAVPTAHHHTTTPS